MTSTCAFVKPIRRFDVVTAYSVNWPRPNAYITSAKSKEVADRLLLVCQAQPATATKIELQVACERARAASQTEDGVGGVQDAEGGTGVASAVAASAPTSTVDDGPALGAATSASVAQSEGDQTEAAVAAALHAPQLDWNWICINCGGCNIAVFSHCRDCRNARTGDAQLVEPAENIGPQSGLVLTGGGGEAAPPAVGLARKRPACASKGPAHHSFTLAQKRAIVREALQRFGCTCPGTSLTGGTGTTLGRRGKLWAGAGGVRVPNRAGRYYSAKS